MEGIIENKTNNNAATVLDISLLFSAILEGCTKIEVRRWK